MQWHWSVSSHTANKRPIQGLWPHDYMLLMPTFAPLYYIATLESGLQEHESQLYPMWPKSNFQPRRPFLCYPWHMVILLKTLSFIPHSSVLVWPLRTRSFILEVWICNMSFSYGWGLNPAIQSRIWFEIEKGEKYNVCIYLKFWAAKSI